MFSMTYNPSALDEWLDAVRRFAEYRQGLAGALRWLGEQFVERDKEGHPPGGPHAPPGSANVYGKNAYIDESGYLTDSIGFSLEPMHTWDPTTGTASALPTLFLFETAPYADAVEYGVPGHSRAYPHFWPLIEELLPLGLAKVAEVMAQADAIRVVPQSG